MVRVRGLGCQEPSGPRRARAPDDTYRRAARPGRTHPLRRPAMQALTGRPGTAGSLAVEDVPEPGTEYGDLLVQGLALGVCGTDREIADGEFGAAPPGRDTLVLGHEIGRASCRERV